MKKIAIIGGGYTGFICAYEILSVFDKCSVVIFDKDEVDAKGNAYSTNDDLHVLNVPAYKMSAYCSRPDDFVEWLNLNHADGLKCGDISKDFVSRSLYGRYLTEQMNKLGLDNERVSMINSEVVSIHKDSNGCYSLCDINKNEYNFDAVVLANGNAPHRDIFNQDLKGLIINPWHYDSVKNIEDSSKVVIVGSGLTMVDLVLSLKQRGFLGTVVSYSLLGYAPMPHANYTHAYPEFVSDFTVEKSSFTLGKLYSRVKLHVQRHKNSIEIVQSIIDSLRPYSQSLWKMMSKLEQRRFLRHIRPYWDVVRHRVAPKISQQIQDYITNNSLVIRRGKFKTVEIGAKNDLLVDFITPDGRVERISCDYLINGTGISTNIIDASVLFKQVLDDSLLSLDENQLGIQMVDDFRVSSEERIYVAGPLTRAKLWENIAIPDIRKHASDLSKEILRDLA